jgi:hypothetical protein
MRASAGANRKALTFGDDEGKYMRIINDPRSSIWFWDLKRETSGM